MDNIFTNKENVTLHPIDENFEKGNYWLWLEDGYESYVAVSCLLGVILRKLADTGYGVVKHVTAVSDRVRCLHSDLRLALKDQNFVCEGWHLGQCGIGDFLRCNMWLKGDGLSNVG